MWEWLFGLTSHQLDVLRTIAIVIGSGCVPLFGFILTWLLRIVNRNTKQAVHQTAQTQWVNGEQKHVSVAEFAKRAFIAGEAGRQETADFYQEWAKGNGRRRLPTSEIDSHYTGRIPNGNREAPRPDHRNESDSQEGMV